MTKKKILLTIGALLLSLEILVLAWSPSLGFGAPVTYPIPEAEVHAHNITGFFGGEYDSTNSSGGYFMNSSLTEVGTYGVDASANGYIAASMNTTIASLSDKNIVNIVLNRSGIIEGKILGQSGHPVIGAYVDLYSNSSLVYIDETQTDSNGMYYFATNVATGAYYIKVSFEFPTYYVAYQDNPYLQNGYVQGQSGIIMATQGAVTVAPNLILNSSGIITGYVKDDLGNPIPNATVSGSMFAYPNDYFVSAITDSNGLYRISYNVINGTYTLTPSFTPIFELYVAGETMVNATQTGTVIQNFTMFKTATISGQVWRTSDDKPVPDVVISTVDDTFTYFGSATTATNGSYSINDGQGPGNYTVTVSLQGQTINQTRILNLAARQNITLNFYIDAYFISGTVYENSTSTGVRVSYPYIDLSFSNFTVAGGSTEGDINGSYLLPLAIVNGTNGIAYNATFDLTASGYNETFVNASITVGNDLANENFALPKSPPYHPPPPPPSATITGIITGTSGPNLPFSYEWWQLSDSGHQFMVGLNASSYVDFVDESLSAKSIYIGVWGPEGTNGSLTIWIPDAIFQGSITPTVYPGPLLTQSTGPDNGTYRSMTITYSHSGEYITFTTASAVPEFQGPIALMTILSVFAIAIYLQKRPRTQLKR